MEVKKEEVVEEEEVVAEGEMEEEEPFVTASKRLRGNMMILISKGQKDSVSEVFPHLLRSVLVTPILTFNKEGNIVKDSEEEFELLFSQEY